jgi:hypothetical protein
MPKIVLLDTDEHRGNLLVIKLNMAYKGKHHIKKCTVDDEAEDAILVGFPDIVIINRERPDVESSHIHIAAKMVGATTIIIYTRGDLFFLNTRQHSDFIILREDDISLLKMAIDEALTVDEIIEIVGPLIICIPKEIILVEKGHGIKVKDLSLGFIYRLAEDLFWCMQDRDGCHTCFVDNIYYHSPMSNTNMEEDFAFQGVMKINRNECIQKGHVADDDPFDGKTITLENGITVEPSKRFMKKCDNCGIKGWKDFPN